MAAGARSSGCGRNMERASVFPVHVASRVPIKTKAPEMSVRTPAAAKSPRLVPLGVPARAPRSKDHEATVTPSPNKAPKAPARATSLSCACSGEATGAPQRDERAGDRRAPRRQANAAYDARDGAAEKQ